MTITLLSQYHRLNFKYDIADYRWRNASLPYMLLTLYSKIILNNIITKKKIGWHISCLKDGRPKSKWKNSKLSSGLSMIPGNEL
jgi:hypothetical protein